MKKIFHTERLLVREFDLTDAAFIIELLNSPGWLEYIGDRKVHTIEEAQNYMLNGPMKSYESSGFGLWMVELAEDATPIGMCGLIRRDYLEHVDIGFAFLPAFTGKGYGQESALATMAYAKNMLSMNKLCAITVQQNTKSIRLLQQLGMKFSKMINIPNGTELLMLFEN